MQVLPIVNTTYEVYKNTIDILAHADKKWRYGFGASLEKDILDLLGILIMAKNAPKTLKGSYLIKASSLQEIILLKFRLCIECEICNETRVFQIQSKVADIGRMLGGWIKSIQST